MKIGSRIIDHIVYCVPDLKNAMAALERQLGVAPVYGGRHQSQGTHNALLDLGLGCYLEILAVDLENKEMTDNRWMGIDLIIKPAVTRWALKSENLNDDQVHLNAYNDQLGIVSEGARLTSTGTQLVWSMILPQAEPRVELIPFMVDWSSSDTHPTEALTKGCRLTEINLSGPTNPSLAKCLNSLLNQAYQIPHAEEPSLSITIEGRYGKVTL